MIKKRLLSIIALAIVTTASVTAQSPVDGFMQGKGKGNVVLSYGMEKYDKVFLVPKEVDGVPVFREVEISSAALYATYGITDQLDLVVSLPYVAAEGNASEAVLTNLNFENKRSGLQDFSVFLKFNPFNYNIGSSKLSFTGVLGYKAPAGDYKVDEGLQSIIAIGKREKVVSLIGIAMFKTKSGIFATGQFGGLMNVNNLPDAYMSEIKLGYAASKFYGDVFLANQTSVTGVDILANGFQGFFPATKVDLTRVGLNLYAPVYKSIGVAGGANTYIEGRNLGKATGFYGALVYKF
jgi:hypothetical protein